MRTIIGNALKVIGGILVVGCAYDLYPDNALGASSFPILAILALLGGAAFFLVGELITEKSCCNHISPLGRAGRSLPLTQSVALGYRISRLRRFSSGAIQSA
jgi:hypothetical protein